MMNIILIKRTIQAQIKMAFKIVKKIRTGLFVKRFKQQKRKLPKQIGNIALNHFLVSFRTGKFNDYGAKQWKARGDGQPSRLIGYPDRRRKKPDGGSGGALRGSLRVKSANWLQIKVGSYGIDYASIHNRGLRGKAWGKHDFTMPKRQFIGDSRKLNRKISKKINREIKSIFK
jgi:phage gpG-like protein